MTQKTASIVLTFLGLIVLVATCWAGWLASGDSEVPEFLVAVGTGSLGGLIGVLSPSAARPE